MISFDPLTVLYFIVALVPAIVVHELSHGLVADRMGDLTPRLSGRLTLNPARHVDPFGTIVLPALLLLPHLFGRGGPVFGYAKPMPVNTSGLKNPDRQMMWIALVGPLSNLVMAAIAALIFRFTGGEGSPVAQLLGIFIFVNLLVGAFNLLPIPPLDGAKVVGRFLPTKARQVYQSLEPYGALFMLLIFFLFPGPVFAIVDAMVSGLMSLLVG